MQCDTRRRFSRSVVGLYGYVGMNPGVQLITELNTTHMLYTRADLSMLALALPKRQLALQKSTTAGQRLMWGDATRAQQGSEQGARSRHCTHPSRDAGQRSGGILEAAIRRPGHLRVDGAREVVNQVAVRAT